MSRAKALRSKRRKGREPAGYIEIEPGMTPMQTMLVEVALGETTRTIMREACALPMDVAKRIERLYPQDTRRTDGL